MEGGPKKVCVVIGITIPRGFGLEVMPGIEAILFNNRRRVRCVKNDRILPPPLRGRGRHRIME